MPEMLPLAPVDFPLKTGRDSAHVFQHGVDEPEPQAQQPILSCGLDCVRACMRAVWPAGRFI
ncbi:hypothetical protein THITH_04245 [Thioalkalivibrio paradoxus ARh 1]|uniref:Uncharacterized protein n=1 Tax=Thioalkalivibrio paradoxus ARh 1 TaxID=713585 RepID=W0DSU0_9GAMM|nr:hypothetical protein THITH_04245 [Thioalkalivibrio paradoxus ARh 1]